MRRNTLLNVAPYLGNCESRQVLHVGRGDHKLICADVQSDSLPGEDRVSVEGFILGRRSSSSPRSRPELSGLEHCFRRDGHVAHRPLQVIEPLDPFRLLRSKKLTTDLVIRDLGYQNLDTGLQKVFDPLDDVAIWSGMRNHAE